MVRFARYLAWVGSALITMSAGFSFVGEPEKLGWFLKLLHGYAVEYRAALMIASPVVVLICQFAGDWGEAHAVKKRVLQTVTLHSAPSFLPTWAERKSWRDNNGEWREESCLGC